LINIKNKIGAMKMLTKASVIIKRSKLMLGIVFSRKSGTMNKLTAIAGNTNNIHFRDFVLITHPLLLTKPLSEVQDTGLREIINQGTKEREVTNATNPSNPSRDMSISCSLNIIEAAVTTRNIRFQKLSLLQRDFIKFILSIFFKLKIRVSSLMIPQLASFLKGIRLWTLICFSTMSHSHTYAEELLPLIAKIEQEHNIPTGLLEAIAIVESQIKPYALCVEGRSLKTKSKEEAMKIVESLRSKGVNNIDLGVMQINLYWHGKRFKNIESMLTPKDNIEYAAKFLNELYQQHGNWNLAVRHYHSAKREHNNKYSRKIIIAWLGN
jgi:hypothetical protein